MPKDAKNIISRKDFLASASMAAAGGGLLLAPAGRALAREGGKRKEARWGFLIDLRKCKGCNTCQVACKTEFDVRLGVFRSGVLHHESGAFPNVKRVFVPWLCNHCDKPACLKICPTDEVRKKFVFPSGRKVAFRARATYKRPDGIVAVDSDRCTGCGSCIENCPYGVRYFDPSVDAGASDSEPGAKAATKCDFCAHRLEKGVVPSCVNTCPARARVIGDLNDPKSEISGILAQEKDVHVLLESEGTEPRCFYVGFDPADAYANGFDTKRRMERA